MEEISCTYRYTDVLRLKFFSFFNSIFNKALIVLELIAIASAIVILLYFSNSLYGIALLSIGIFIIFVEIAYPAISSIFLTKKLSKQDIKCTLGEDSLSIYLSSNVEDINYDRIQKVYETKNTIYFYLDNENVFLFQSIT